MISKRDACASLLLMEGQVYIMCNCNINKCNSHVVYLLFPVSEILVFDKDCVVERLKFC